MSSSFADSFDESVAHTESAPPFEEDADSDTYGDYNSQQFDSFADGNGDVGGGLDGEFDGSNGPILPPPSEMANEEGFALREWRRLNTIRLEEKEKREKEVLSQILEEAEEFKVEFHRKREVTCENNKAANREKEKLSVVIREKFHADADKNYWKAIAELIPNELPTIEKRGKKDQEKKPSIAVIQGPKPGKPTELSRMRQMLIKLKHDSPAHLKLSPALAPSKDAKSSDAAVTADSVKSASVVATPEAVAVA